MGHSVICVFLLLLFTGTCEGSWSYSGPNGPANWGNIAGASACHGRSQSPININTQETCQKRFAPFTFTGWNLPRVARGGAQPRPASMVNNGHVLQGNLEGDFLLRGGGLKGTFKAVQFHMHWGSMNKKGSEHTKNGEAYPAEMHIVHYDSTKHRTFGQAVTSPNGLAVLGFWIKLGPKNRAWEPIINNLKSIKYANQPYIFTKGFPFRSLLPSDLTKFYRYSGSLTTPACEESVIWTMFDKEIILSRSQIAKFRQLSKFQTPPYGPGAGPELHRRLVDNFRPIQRLWFRTVCQSWPHADYDYHGVSNGGAGVSNGGAVVPGWTPKFTGMAAGGTTNTGGAAGPATGGTKPKTPSKTPASIPKKGPGPVTLPKTPASIPKKGPGPVAIQDAGGAVVASEELEIDGYGAYEGYGVGMERLWQALRNGQFGGEQEDFDYYGDQYGNNNAADEASELSEQDGEPEKMAVQEKITIIG